MGLREKIKARLTKVSKMGSETTTRSRPLMKVFGWGAQSIVRQIAASQQVLFAANKNHPEKESNIEIKI